MSAMVESKCGVTGCYGDGNPKSTVAGRNGLNTDIFQKPALKWISEDMHGKQRNAPRFTPFLFRKPKLMQSPA